MFILVIKPTSGTLNVCFTSLIIVWFYILRNFLTICKLSASFNLSKWIQANAICLLKVIHWLIVDMQEYETLHLHSKYGECIAIGSSFILYIYYIYFTKKNGILKRTTSDIFNVEKKTVHVLKQLRTWYICSTRMLKIRFEMLTFNVNLTPF